MFSRNDFVDSVTNFLGPKYDGEYLRSLVRGLLGKLRINQTLTDIVVPAFDIKRLQPVIFSTKDV